MDIDILIDRVNSFKSYTTKQSWQMNDNFSYQNEYINTIKVDSSNKHGGDVVFNGKQWGIIIEIKKDFSKLRNWISLKNYFNEELKITPVSRGVNKGMYGIRFYKMSFDPTDEIIKEILDFIFE